GDPSPVLVEVDPLAWTQEPQTGGFERGGVELQPCAVVQQHRTAVRLRVEVRHRALHARTVTRRHPRSAALRGPCEARPRVKGGGLGKWTVAPPLGKALAPAATMGECGRGW